MKRYAVALTFFIVFAGVLPALLAGSARAEEPADSGIYQVELLAGQDFSVCQSGAILCPARSPICDDLKVATPVDLPSGLAFRGAGSGTTLCSAASSTGLRRLFRITVR